jgi:HEAT repeat protein
MMLSLSPAKVPPLLPWLVHVDAVLGSEVAIELLRRHPDHEDIAAAALVAVLEPAVLPGLARFADSPNADVRQSLAIAYGHLGGLDEIPVLARLLCDPVWWVRYRAGQALLRLKGMDAARLEGVRTQLTDPYALDMLRHVQAEAGA